MGAFAEQLAELLKGPKRGRGPGGGGSATITTEMLGARDLILALEALDEKIRRKATRIALQKASTVVKREARRLVPRKTGELRKAIKKKVRVPRNGEAAAWVGVDPKLNRLGYIVHEGTGPRYRTNPKLFGLAVSTEFGFAGIMPPNPFLRNALSNNLPRIRKIYETVILGHLLGEF